MATLDPPAGGFDAVVCEHWQQIYRVLLAMLRQTDAAENLTQECFLKAFEKRREFRGECSWRTWLLRIAINLARDHLRSRRLQFWRSLFSRAGEPNAGTIADPCPSPERILLARDEAARVRSAVGALAPQQHAIFVLRFVEELSIEEISGITGLRPGTVKTHLFRATRSVRRRLEKRDKP